MKKLHPLFSLVFFTLSLYLADCSPAVAIKQSETHDIYQLLDQIINQPEFKGASWGIMVKAPTTNEIIFGYNPDKLFIPASNTKLFTTATALSTLAPEFRHRTIIISKGKIDQGILNGDLIIKGGGDPTLTSDSSDGSFFRQIFKSLQAKGIEQINGRLVADDNFFDDIALGAAWSWDNLSGSYSAEISALSIDKNIVKLTFSPSDTIGNPAHISIKPNTKYISIENNVKTTTARTDISVERVPDQNKIIVSGTISKGETATKEVSIHNPSLYFVTLLKEFIEKNNIRSGEGVDIDDIPEFTISDNTDTLLVFDSPAINEIVTSINRDSENLYAEMLLKTIGKTSNNKGSTLAGINTMYSFLSVNGVDTTNISIQDGSGLSRKNLISAGTIADLLIIMFNSPQKENFLNSLPIAGTDGTLEHRFTNSPAKGKVLAKTGALDHVKALSGFLVSNKNKPIVFSILANNYVCSYEKINLAQEKICELLVKFY